MRYGIFLAGLAAGSANAIVGGVDPRPADRAPYRSLVRLSLDGRAICSGVHLGRGRVLTAKHCYDGERRMPAVSLLSVDGTALGALERAYDVTSPAPYFREEVTTASGMTIEITQPDVGVVTPRDRAVRERLARLPAARPDLDAVPKPGLWTIAGFGNDHFGAEDTSGFAFGTARIVRSDAFLWYGSFRRGEGHASPSHGDSGGPMFRLRNGVPHVVGISTTFRAVSADFAHFYYVKLTEERTREWLREIVADGRQGASQNPSRLRPVERASCVLGPDPFASASRRDGFCDAP